MLLLPTYVLSAPHESALETTTIGYLTNENISLCPHDVSSSPFLSYVFPPPLLSRYDFVRFID